jgi:uncharacterized membrane protein YedE/YeeE
MEYLTEFTPYRGLIGGILIGISAILFLALNGRIAGISGLVHGLCPPKKTDFMWRLAFLTGLIFGGLTFYLFAAIQFQLRHNFPILLLLIGGFCVGLGTRMGQGCTSGHGVCGIARLSIRSIVATLLFMFSAFVTVYIIRHVGGIY